MFCCCAQVQNYSSEQLCAALDAVASGAVSIAAAVGPAVGCLMATFGTSLITDCIFDFEDPEQLAGVGLQQRLELWGLQVGAILSCVQHASWRDSVWRLGGDGCWVVCRCAAAQVLQYA